MNGIAKLREIPLRLLRAIITELRGSKIPFRWNYSMYNIHELDFEVIFYLELNGIFRKTERKYPLILSLNNIFLFMEYTLRIARLFSMKMFICGAR